MNERLDLLIRRNKGKDQVHQYKKFFKSFNLKNLTYIELEESDIVLAQIRNIFPSIEQENEVIANDQSSKAKLILDTLNRISDSDYCFIFTDEVYNCGMFKCTAKSALNSCLNIAFLTYQNTCFITDCNFKFSLSIDYEDEPLDKDFDTYDIQRKLKN